MGGFEQRPWTPTKRRGPIAAEMSSPGPACVQLPQLLGNEMINSIRLMTRCCYVGVKTGNW